MHAYYNILYRLILWLALVLISTIKYFYARRICSFDFAFTASMVKYRNADGVSYNSVIIYNYTSTRIIIMQNVGTTYISILEDWSELLG